MTATPKYFSEVNSCKIDLALALSNKMKQFSHLKVYNFTIGETGVISSIPYLVKFLCAIGFRFVGDFLFNQKIMSAGAVRKWFSIFCE